MQNDDDQSRVAPPSPCVERTGSTAEPSPGAVVAAERTDQTPSYPYDDEDPDDGEECWYCHGEGGFHDCGEDCCVCLDKDEITEICPECQGRSGL